MKMNVNKSLVFAGALLIGISTVQQLFGINVASMTRPVKMGGALIGAFWIGNFGHSICKAYKRGGLYWIDGEVLARGASLDQGSDGSVKIGREDSVAFYEGAFEMLYRNFCGLCGSLFPYVGLTSLSSGNYLKQLAYLIPSGIIGWGAYRLVGKYVAKDRAERIKGLPKWAQQLLKEPGENPQDTQENNQSNAATANLSQIEDSKV